VIEKEEETVDCVCVCAKHTPLDEQHWGRSFAVMTTMMTMLKAPSFLLPVFVAGLLVAGPSFLPCTAAKQIEPIYTDGNLGRNFESWSWGINYLDFEDICPGHGEGNQQHHHTTCLCAEVIPYGALSFKTSAPFSPFGGSIHLQVYTDSNTGGLQMQLESSSESEYSISDIVDISNKNHKNKKGHHHFIEKEISLTPMSRTAEAFDRIVLGNCLENDATCLEAGQSESTRICIQSMYIETRQSSSHRASKFNGN
jgi:hypothetical protein